MLLSLYYVSSIIAGCIRDIFINLSQFIEKHVTVEFFIYFVFLPIAIIPSILINHAGRYTLPYPCRRSRVKSKSRSRSSRSSRSRGYHLACYNANLRKRVNVIDTTTTTFKGDHRSHRHNSYSYPSKSTTGKAAVSSPTLSTRKCFSADDEVNALIASDPSISLDLFLFESKLYWENILSTSPITTVFSSNAIDLFLLSIDALDHYRTIQSLLPSSQYKSIDPASLQFQRILLEARGLQTSIKQYGEVLPLSSPAIYVSTNKDDLPIVIDTGASCTITPTLSDFISTPTKSDTASLGSLTTVQTKVSGQGLIEWDIEDVNGVLKKLRTISYYVPEATIRLFSPQAYFKANPKGSLTLNIDGIFIHMPCGTSLKFPIQSGSNLPIMLTRQALHRSRTQNSTSNFKSPHKPSLNTMSNILSFICSTTYDHFVHGTVFHLQHAGAMAALISDDAVLKQANSNLSPEQKELLLWHYRLGHIGISRVQSLLQKPRTNSFNDSLSRLIVPSNNKSSHCHAPLCSSCQYAKQKRKNPPKSSVSMPLTTTGLSDDILNAGDRVSVDIYCSSTKGRLPHTFGKEKSEIQFTGGAIFVDHASRLIHNTHQHSTTTAETVLSKHLFEDYCDSFGVRIREYVTDNNPFHGADWVNDCKNQRQSHKLSGVGAHHQNYAERNIQSIFNMARAMLIHFAMHWPQASSTDLWPFAVDQAIYIWNHLPATDTKLSPIELFTQTKFHNHHHLQNLHVFGCPVYVLEPKLQDAKKLPKWNRRSRRAVYLGYSRQHSNNVHMVLNLETGKISPQYHLVFDDTFSTVYSDGAFNADVWNSLVTSNLELHDDAPTTIPSTFEFTDDNFNNSTGGTTGLPIRPIPNSPTTTADPTSIHSFIDNLPTPSTEFPSLPADIDDHLPSTNNGPEASFRSPLAMNRPSSTPEGGRPFSSPEGGRPHPSSSSSTSSPKGGRLPSSPEGAFRRSSRFRKPVERLNLLNSTRTIDPKMFEMFDSTPCPKGSRQITFRKTDQPPRVTRESINQQFLSKLRWDQFTHTCSNAHSALGSFISEHRRYLSKSNLLDYLNPAAMATLANKDDNPTFKEAMSGPDAGGFITAMEAEIVTLIELNVFDVVARDNNMKVLSGVWALKRKRYPDGSIRKLKARYCARGFEQVEGIDYFETFAPVVMWLTVRLLLIMSILLKLETTQIDYTAAFVHADIDCLVYVAMPPGFGVPGQVWKLRKSLYGLAQSPRNYFLYTRDKLIKMGFVQSEADPCLFISADIICLIYVDDALLFYKDKQSINILTDKMKLEGMLFREEESVAGYLGVHIDRRDDGTIHLTQKGLADKIVDSLHLSGDEVNAVDTPCTKYVPIDEDGELAHGEFSYPSVVGQLNYLQGHSRPDITLATSQVARFVHKPKRSHELALIRLGRYLKGTAAKGIILQPINLSQLNIDVYVDAAFACGWGSECGTNPESVKSRTGYIIEVAGCPVLWVSKLQSTIATSTMESEYTALSMALRAAIPLIAVTKAVANGLVFTRDRILTFKATVHEDNQGAIILANLEPGRHTPRSKFYALRLHWFRSWLKPNEIEIIFISTKLQKADYLTKPLQSMPFAVNRKLSMGW
jgi:hypothetical protein